MVRNSHFRGNTIASTPFSYGKFGLQKVENQRGNGVPIAGHQWIPATAHVYITTQCQHWASTGVAMEF